MIIVDIMEKHVDSAEVVGRLVDLLTEETLLHILLTDDFGYLHEERTRTTGRVIDLAHFRLVMRSNTGEQFAHFLRREIFSTGLTCIASVHLHEELIRIAESIDMILFRSFEIHVAYCIQDTCETFIAFVNR